MSAASGVPREVLAARRPGEAGAGLQQGAIVLGERGATRGPPRPAAFATQLEEPARMRGGWKVAGRGFFSGGFVAWPGPVGAGGTRGARGCRQGKQEGEDCR